MNPWHQVDAHDLSVADVPAILLCFLRVTSLHVGSVSMSELLAPSYREMSRRKVGEVCSIIFEAVLTPLLVSLEGCVRFHMVQPVIFQLQILAQKSFPSYFTASPDLSRNRHLSS